MRDDGRRAGARFLVELAVIGAASAATTVAIRRASTPSGRRALARRAERTGRHLRFWCDWLASLRDDRRGGCSEPAVTGDVAAPAAPVEERSATA
jgi:hypothetical protein